jgi:hypothetical protein
MRDETQLKAGLEMKKPPAALAGGGLGAAFQLSGSSGFPSRARIKADNSHGRPRRGGALDQNDIRVGAGSVHNVD